MSWELKKLDDLGTVSRGRSRHRPRDADHLYGGPYPFIQTGDVKHSELFINSYSQTYSEAGLAQSKLWPKGTLCITIAANIADTSILDIEACFPDSIIGFIADEQKANTLFVKYLFDAVLQRRYKKFSHGATQDNLSQTKLLSIDFPVPPLPIQNRIASILSAYDELIQNNKRRIELLEKSARLLYKEWFVQLRFPGHEHTKIVDGVPEGWEKLKIGDVFDTASGGTPSRKNPEYFTGDINWAKTQELNEGYLFETEEKITEQAINNSSAKLFPSETLLVSIYGGTNIGRSTILANPSASNQACVALWPNHPAVSNYYGQLFFQNNRSYLIGLAQGAAQTNISQKVLKSVEILVSTEPLHEYFLSIVEPIYEQIKRLQLSLNHLKKARDLLLPKLMNGDIPV